MDIYDNCEYREDYLLATYNPGIYKNSRKLKLSILAATISLINSAYIGKAVAETEDPSLEEIVVVGRTEFFRPTSASSATKFDLPVNETPQAISILTDDILNTFGTKDVFGVDKFIAGVNSTGNGASTNYFLGHIQARGFALDQLSGYKINGFSTIREFQPDMVAVQQVEFLKGPSSVVYGVNNYGGTINTILKTPEGKKSNALAAQFGSYESYRISYDSTGPLNQSGTYRYRAATAWEDRHSIKEDFEFERFPLYLSLQGDVTEQLQLDTYLYYQDENSVDDFGLVGVQKADGNIDEPFYIDRKIFMGDSDYNKTERESLQIFTSLKNTFNNGFYLQGKVGYTENITSYQAIYVYNYGYLDGPFVDVYTKVDEREISSWDSELSFGGEFDLGEHTNTFIVLMEYRELDFEFDSFPFDYVGNVDQTNPDFSGFANNLNSNILGVSNGGRDEDQERLALAAQVLFRPTDKLSVLLGARWDSVKQSVVDIKFDPDPTDDVIFSERNLQSQTDNKQITFRGGIVYEINSDLNGYLNYSEGFLPQEGITRSGSTIDPEEGIQWELGLKGEFFDGKLGTNVALFKIYRKDVAIADPTNNFQLQEDFRITGGEQDHEGIEIELMGEVTSGLNLILTYAYLDTEIKKESVGLPFGDSSLGNSVIGAPDKTASLFFEYQFKGNLLEDISLNGGASYVGRRPTQQQNLVGEYGGGPGFPIVLLDDYLTVDFGLRYFGIDDFIISLQVTNVFDEDYFNAAQLDADCCAVNFLQRGQSREFNVDITYDF